MVKRKLVLPMKRSSPASGTMPKIVVSGLVQWVSDLPSSERAPVFFLSGDQTLQGLSQYLAWSQMHPGAIDDVFGYAIRSWVRESLWESLLDRVRVAKPAFTERLPAWFPPEPEVWELLWGIGSVSEFVVEEPLRAIVDQKAYLAHEFYRLLWEVRFLVRENLNLSKAQSLVQNITKWAFGEGPPDRGFFSDYNVPVLDLTLSQRYDLLWMLLTVHDRDGWVVRSLGGAYIFSGSRNDDKYLGALGASGELSSWCTDPKLRCRLVRKPREAPQIVPRCWSARPEVSAFPTKTRSPNVSTLSSSLLTRIHRLLRKRWS